MELTEIMAQLEFCSARLHVAENAELEKIRDHLLLLQDALNKLE